MQLSARQAHLRVAMFLGFFIALHFVTHFSALGGVERHSQTLNMARFLYRFPPIEMLLIAAFAVQIWLGIHLLRGIAKRPNKDRWHRAQQISGMALAAFIILHTSSALIARWGFSIDTNFYWPAGTLVLSPLKYGFAPYYAAAIIALVTHIIAALHFRNRAKWHAPALLLGPAIAVPVLSAYGGVFFNVTLPPAHQAYFDAYLSLITL